MYQLSLGQRARIIGAICEGNSIRATCRLTGAAKGTVLRLLAEVGEACQAFHDETVRGIKASRVQCDEIWSFCHAKARNVTPAKIGQAGDLWTWVALDQDSKLAISYLVADRGQEAATFFARDLASRLANRIQLTTDGHSVYLAAIAAAFHYDVDYAMLVKRYGAAPSQTHGVTARRSARGRRRLGSPASPASLTCPRRTSSARTSRCGCSRGATRA